ncbi:MAG: outer membrane beta-barrel protein [Alphaproteobacteria bacterium]|nr:outer membrane beta-barrel protein [Alphaproteobacteria bacterium]
MNYKVALLGTVAALSLVAARDSSAKHQGWYVGIEAGANWIDDTEFAFDDNFFDDAELAIALPPSSLSPSLNFDTGWAALGTVGYAFDNNWRIEGELGFRQNDADVIFGGKSVSAFSGELTEYSAMVNVLYDIPLAEKLSLSVGAGVGADYSQFDDGAGFDDNDISFAYQAIAGLSYELTNRLDLTLTYRYLHVNSPEYSDTVGRFEEAYKLDDLEKHTVTVGLRYDLYEDEAPVMAPAAPPPAPALEPTKQFIVFFGFNKSNLTPEALGVIREAAAAAKTQGSASILVVGHTDTVGSNKYNDALALRRSGAVKSGLVAEGIAAGGITTTGKGENELLVKTDDNVKEPQNRRATINLN